MHYEYSETNRIGDHIWWISDVTKFKAHYPVWTWKYNINDILTQIFEATIKKQ
jgi:CDP-paratose 2-epimerase